MKPVVQKLLAMMQKPAKENLKTVRSKYNDKVFHEVMKGFKVECYFK